MTLLETQETESRLAGVVFRLEWDDSLGRRRYGTGFFIGADGVALTAYHNLSDDLLADPEWTQEGHFGNVELRFRWLLREDKDRAWQKAHDIAILQADATPASVTLAKSLYLPGDSGAQRGGIWAGREVAMRGYPRLTAFAPYFTDGRIDHSYPLRDHALMRDGVKLASIPGTIQIAPNLPGGKLTELRGVSGSPVYDIRHGGIVGVVVGVDNQVAASELWPAVEHWPEGQQYIERLRPQGPPPAPWRWRWLLLAPVIALGAFGYRHIKTPAPLTVTVPTHLAVDVVRVDTNRREPLREDSAFTLGEKVRFMITAPAAGDLYIVDRELNLKGEPGQPELIFPTARTGMGRNRVSAGVPIPFPAEDEDPPYLEPKPTNGNTDYGGELLTVLLYANPLKIELKPDPILLSPDQIPLDGREARTFVQPTDAPGKALAVQQIRVSVRPAGR